MSKRYKGKIFQYSDGSIAVETSGWAIKGAKEVDNFEFTDELTFHNTVTSTASTHVKWIASDGKVYTSTAALLEYYLLGQGKSRIEEGRGFIIYGNFTFRKQGSSVFLTLVD